MPIREPSEMPKLIAGLMALTALAASILAQADAMTCLTRGAIAFIVGYFCGILWHSILGNQQKPHVRKEASQSGKKPQDAAEPQEGSRAA